MLVKGGLMSEKGAHQSATEFVPRPGNLNLTVMSSVKNEVEQVLRTGISEQL